MLLEPGGGAGGRNREAAAAAPVGVPESVRETPLFAMPFMDKNEYFTKTGSGQM
jgi:hypothetical protein